jgi:predicted O-linked N-acetylglucosamine transferase (SPINDLY family)
MSQPSPSPAKARFMRLAALFQKGALDEAEKETKAALATAPKDPNYLHLAAQIAEARGEQSRAIMLYRKALMVNPEWMEAEYNLARVLADVKEYGESLALMQKVTTKRPDLPPVWESLAKINQRAGKLRDAIAAWAKAIKLAPQNVDFRSQCWLLRAQVCDWAETPAPDQPLTPQAAIVFFNDPALQKKAAISYSASKYGRIAPLPAATHAPHTRLRIGYLSADFQAHATAWLMAELFELHDKTAFEIFVYSTGADDKSSIRQRIENSAAHFIDLRNTADLDAAQRIRGDEIDILIDLKGHTRGNRLGIFAHRPAPKQIHWLGYPGTLGAPFIDGFVGDAIALPKSLEPFFTERVLRLPASYQINDRQRAIAEPLSRAEYGLPENAIILASFNQTYKITPTLFTLWCDILKERPATILWLLESNATAAENLRKEAEKRGINPARLVFAKPTALEDHLARYKIVDLALDTFPVGGHTTTSDALWAGCPVVTLIGQSFISRVAASLLHAANLPDLVTEDLAAYKNKILSLIDDPAARRALRQKLTGDRDNLPLFDTPRFVKDWEKLLKSLY